MSDINLNDVVTAADVCEAISKGVHDAISDGHWGERYIDAVRYGTHTALCKRCHAGEPCQARNA